jgi:hypothetical protein
MVIVVTTLMQIPYGAIIAISILACVFLNDRLPPNNRCFMIILFMLPNITGAFGLLCTSFPLLLLSTKLTPPPTVLPSTSQIPRLIMYYLTGPYNASFVLLLSVLTKKVLTNATLFVGMCVGNISGPFFYKTAQAPRYGLGIGSMVVAHVAEVLLILGLRWGLKRENERRERDGVGGDDRVGDGGFGREEEEERRRKDLDRTAFADLTDRENLNFRYIY